MSSIWETLNGIDCKKHAAKKGNFTYLAWTWAWSMVKEKYPLARYELLDDTIYPDGTMEVRLDVTIMSEESAPLTHTMWLPVLNHQNKAIANPNAFDINSARMRCLVKCLAMFGLGAYIYAGESEPYVEAFTSAQKDEYVGIMASGDGWAMKQFGKEVGNDLMTALFNDAPAGEKTKQKKLCNELVTKANTELKASLAGIQEALDIESPTAIEEILAECVGIERDFVVNGMTQIQTKQAEDLGVTL